jgi:quercetin dioxygenase-like cupin family protein
MTMPVSVNEFSSKSHETPDERRTPEKTQVDIVHVEGFTLGRFTFQPGWRWSECIKPVVGTERCQLSHVGYAVSGQLAIELPDGNTKMINAGDSYAIPPGHDAYVDGAEPFVAIEITSADEYAKPQ